MRLPYDKTNEKGEKIREEPTDSGIKEVNMTKLVGRAGRRTTNTVDILVYEALADEDPDEEDVQNRAVPGSEEVWEDAKERIDRARERGLSAAEAIGAFDDETEDQTRQSFKDGLDSRTGDPMTEAIQQDRNESVGGPQNETADDDHESDDQDDGPDESYSAADALGGGR